MRPIRATHSSAALVSLLVLAACGGGGGGSSPTVLPTATPTPGTSITVGFQPGPSATPTAPGATPTPVHGATATPTPAGSPVVTPTPRPTATPVPGTPTPRPTATALPGTPTPTPVAVTPTPVSTLSGHVLVVGPGKPYSSITAAVNASVDGDTIAVVSGTYTNDFPKFVWHNITIIGVGGMVHEVATTTPANDKGFFAVEAGLTIKNFEFSGLTIPSSAGNNGAGIRLDNGDLNVQYCYFHNNQDGILGGTPSSHVTIDHSEFAYNGAGDGYSHNIYINNAASLTFTNNYSHDAVVGHDLKSRATVTTISNSVIGDTSVGSASYDIDVPDGGVVTIGNNTLIKGPHPQNPWMVHYGGEGANKYATNSLQISNNIFINNYGARAGAVLNQAANIGLSVTAQILSNQFYGFSSGQIVSGASNLVSNTLNPIGSAPTPSTSPPWASAPVLPIP